MSAQVAVVPRNPVALIVTPLTDMDAYAIAEDALMGGTTKLPPILVRARVKDALVRVSQASREQSGVVELLAAVGEDAAGETVPALLRAAADAMRAAGGGPLEDRLRLAADALDAAIILADPGSEPIEVVCDRIRAAGEAFLNAAGRG